jgi:predicted oxidoreductase (fatty acid repression mutant protein)
MAPIHNRKLIAALAKELKEKDSEIQGLMQRVISTILSNISIQTRSITILCAEKYQ